MRAPRKVVILDCCYSGRALEGGMGLAVANRTVTDGTHVMTASGATERAWSPPGEEHTAFTGELIRVLEQGIPGGPELLTTDTVYRHVHTELTALDRPLPHQTNRNAGGDIVVARNRAVSGDPPPPRPRKRAVRTRPWDFWRSWRMAAKLALVFAVTLTVITATALFLKWGPAQLGRCDVADPVPGVTAEYSCRGSDDRLTVVNVYPDRKTLDPVYERAVADADVPPSTGDCATEEDAEHRYPLTGTAKGRVLCFTVDATTTLLWTDDAAHAVARIVVPVTERRKLRASWASSVAQAPPFPTADEKALIDLPVAAGCARAGIEEMDDFPGAIAAVTCDETGGAGAQSVTYFRFDSLDKLQKTMSSHIPADTDPTKPGCRDGNAPKFTDARRYDERGVFIGLLLCHPAADGSLVIEWSVEALKLAGRAVGSDATELAGWWRANRGPPIEKTVEAVNQTTGFPDAAESALLKLIPPNSQRFCMRPSGEYSSELVHENRKAVGVVCGPKIGPAVAFYYQFSNKADLLDNYDYEGEIDGICTDSPTAVNGESAYSRGRLFCQNRDGSLTRVWTDERRLIQVFAFRGRDAKAMSDWWEHDAGPL